MRALVFGQSGLDKAAYLAEVLKTARAQGKDFKVLSVGDRMREIDPEHRDPQLFPSLSPGERELLRGQALKAILNEVKASPDVDYVLCAHAVFKLSTGLIPAAGGMDLLSEFNPDVIFVIIDDLHYTHRRLQGSPYEDLALGHVLDWRDAEILQGRIVAQNLFDGRTRDGFFVLARGHHPKMMFRLLYERESRLRIYASFAITSATPEQRAEIAAFKKRLGEKYIVFDPYKISERGIFALAEAQVEEMAEKSRDVESIGTAYAALLGELRKLGLRPEITLQDQFSATEVLPGMLDLTFRPGENERGLREDPRDDAMFDPFVFQLQELASLKPVVDGQIISRDYLLIDQSDVVCALVPMSKVGGKAEISAGSQSELTYANLTAKDRFVLWTGKKTALSPFVGTPYPNFDALEKALEKRAKKKAPEIH